MKNSQKGSVSIEEFVRNITKKWEEMHSDEFKKLEADLPVITVSMEPGSGGCLIAKEIASQLGFDFFHRDIIHKIAESARISAKVIESLEKERLSGVQDFIASLVKDSYIHPSIYLEHLMKIVSTIGKHGRAVIVGRGANFILPPEERFSVRVIAPLETRIANVTRLFGVPSDTAKRRIMIRQSKRQAFVRQSFNADINDPGHYDLVINSGRMNVESAVEAVIGAVVGCLGKNKKGMVVK